LRAHYAKQIERAGYRRLPLRAVRTDVDVRDMLDAEERARFDAWPAVQISLYGRLLGLQA
jgi:hypothetical protein